LIIYPKIIFLWKTVFDALSEQESVRAIFKPVWLSVTIKSKVLSETSEIRVRFWQRTSERHGAGNQAGIKDLSDITLLPGD